MKKRIIIALLILFMLPCALLLSGCIGGDGDGGGGGKSMTTAEFREMISDSGLWGTDIHIMDNTMSGSKEVWFNGSGDDIKLKMPARTKMINSNTTTAYKHYGKIGNDYYEVITYTGLNTENNRIEVVLTEYAKLTRDECLSIIRFQFDSYFANWNKNLEEDIDNKQNFIKIFGEDNYYYRETFEDGSQYKLKIETTSFRDEYTFENIQIGVEENDITTHTIPTEVVYEIVFDIETEKFVSFSGSSTLKSEYDFNRDGRTCDLSASISLSTDPTNLTFTMPTFEIDNDNEDKDVDITEVTGDDKVSVYYRNCTSNLANGLATPFEDFALPTPSCQENYQFLGWFDNYNNQYTSTLNVSGYSSTITLYAKWQDAKDPIINLNGGTLVSKPTGLIFVSQYISEIEAFKPGYYLKDWTNDSGNSCKYGNSVQISPSYVINAQWEKKITVSFDANGSTPKLGIINQPSGTNVTLPSNIKKENKIFAGWYSDEQFTNYVPINYVVPENDVTLYAKFDDAYVVTTVDLLDSINKYVIPVNGNYDDFKELYEEVINVQSVEKTNGIICFGGWYTDSTFTTPFTAYPTSNITIYAKQVNEWFFKFGFVGDYAETFESSYGTNGYFDVVKDGDLYYNNMNSADRLIIYNLFDIGDMDSQDGLYSSLSHMLTSAFNMNNCMVDGIYLDAEKTNPLFSTERDTSEEVLDFWIQHFEGPLTFYVEIVSNEQP